MDPLIFSNFIGFFSRIKEIGHSRTDSRTYGFMWLSVLVMVILCIALSQFFFFEAFSRFPLSKDI